MQGLLPDIDDLTDAQFARISELVKRLAGINLHTGKKELVKARLGKKLRKKGFRSFDDYIRAVENDKTNGELTAMLDALSTNLTSFFREADHFDYLRETIIAEMMKDRLRNKRLRIWSAGCSSGEEPYSIAITLCEAIQRIELWDARILATDLSTRVLARARKGIYEEDRFKDVPAIMLAQYFTCTDPGPPKSYQAGPKLRQLVNFAHLNLMEPWPMSGPFDVIFCRNVMIYFDKKTQADLVERYWQLLRTNGVLFIGHSESLTSVRHRFKYMQPTVYVKR